MCVMQGAVLSSGNSGCRRQKQACSHQPSPLDWQFDSPKHHHTMHPTWWLPLMLTLGCDGGLVGLAMLIDTAGLGRMMLGITEWPTKLISFTKGLPFRRWRPVTKWQGRSVCGGCMNAQA